MLRLLLIPLLCLGLLGTAVADDDFYMPFDEDAYTSEYFGTTLIVFMTERLDYPEDSWWTDALPEEMMMDQAYLVGLVNGARNAAGAPRLDPDGWYINFGYESETDGGWEYDINFFDMSPADVKLILDNYGGAGEVFPAGQFSLLPCITRDFYADTEYLDEDIILTLSDQSYSFDPRMPVDELYDEVSLAFNDAYGQEVFFDLYVYSFIDQNGNAGAQLNVYANLPAG